VQITLITLNITNLATLSQNSTSTNTSQNGCRDVFVRYTVINDVRSLECDRICSIAEGYQKQRYYGIATDIHLAILSFTIRG
jgi:hypothetical protein